MAARKVLIIAEHLPPARAPQAWSWAWWIGSAALVWGGIAAVLYARHDLTLAHYDARAHLVVARRVVDSLTPGWLQFGAFWLPLPHLLNFVPAQSDTLYRTGTFAVAVSVLAFAVATGALAWLVLSATGSRGGALAAASLLALNPNVLYLQATPMTEPLLLALSLLAVAATYRWITDDGATPISRPGLLLSAACLTRYEAWSIGGALIPLACLAFWRGGRSLPQAARLAGRLALYLLAPIVGFVLWSRISVGQWLITGGFFAPDNPAGGDIRLVLTQVARGLREVVGRTAFWAFLPAGVGLVGAALRSRARTPLLAVVALAAAAALPCVAFYQSHPFRIRYMVPLVPAVAATAGMALGLLPRGRALAAALLVSLVVVDIRPFDPRAPMLREALVDRENSLRRRVITAVLAREYDGEKILASMSSLAHYMHETASAGFQLRDYLHEGNGDLWDAAVAAPTRHVGWVLIRESDREGRDALGRLMRQNPTLLDGFVRAAEGGGVTLYRRVRVRDRALETGP